MSTESERTDAGTPNSPTAVDNIVKLLQGGTPLVACLALFIQSVSSKKMDSSIEETKNQTAVRVSDKQMQSASYVASIQATSDRDKALIEAATQKYTDLMSGLTERQRTEVQLKIADTMQATSIQIKRRDDDLAVAALAAEFLKLKDMPKGVKDWAKAVLASKTGVAVPTDEHFGSIGSLPEGAPKSVSSLRETADGMNRKLAADRNLVALTDNPRR